MKRRKLMNSADKLKRREAEGDRPSSSRAFEAEHFRRMHIQEAFDPIHFGVHNLMLHTDGATKIVRIQKIDRLIFVIAASGLCAVFDRVSGARLGILNQKRHEKVLSLHFNDLDGSVISVSKNLRSGRCHRIPLVLMRNGNFQQRVKVFGTLDLPPFMRFRNGLAFIHNAELTYDIYDMRNYARLFSVTDLDYVECILPLPEMIIIFRQVVRDVTTSIVRNIRDGTVIKEFLLPSDEVRHPCIVKEQLLYNDQNGNSNVLDMRTSTVNRLKSDKLKTAKFGCLPKSDLLLSCERGRYSFWELDTRKDSDELELLCQGRFTGRTGVLVIHDGSVVISYYRPRDGSASGSISFTHLRTGRLMAKIINDVPEPNNLLEAETLDNISCMYYDEEKEELYSGTTDGGFQRWSS